MQKRKPRVIEWNSCVDVPLVRGVLVHVLLLDRCDRQTSDKRTHADLLVGAQVLADQCKQSAGESLWVSHLLCSVHLSDVSACLYLYSDTYRFHLFLHRPDQSPKTRH